MCCDRLEAPKTTPSATPPVRLAQRCTLRDRHRGHCRALWTGGSVLASSSRDLATREALGESFPLCESPAVRLRCYRRRRLAPRVGGFAKAPRAARSHTNRLPTDYMVHKIHGHWPDVVAGSPASNPSSPCDSFSRNREGGSHLLRHALDNSPRFDYAPVYLEPTVDGTRPIGLARSGRVLRCNERRSICNRPRHPSTRTASQRWVRSCVCLDAAAG